MTSSPNKDSNQIMPWWKRILLPWVATLTVPPYAMQLCLMLYGTLVYATPPRWRAVWLAYWGYCILDTSSPTRPQIMHNSNHWILRKHLQPYLGSIWWIRWTAEYFQARLVKTVDLPATNKATYIFAYHPHGVISMGANLALSTDACQFTKVFPGIVRSVVTLNVCFWVPFYRHWMLWLGCCSANKATLHGRLQANESLVLVPGGAAEALYAQPQSFVVAIRKRMGFIKLAQDTQAQIVPVLGFGENDLFETVSSSSSSSSSRTTTKTTILWRMQYFLYRRLTFSIPLWYHFFPKNHTPLTVVVGAPVVFPEDSSLEERHALYLQALETLYNTHKAKYGYEKIPLELV